MEMKLTSLQFLELVKNKELATKYKRVGVKTIRVIDSCVIPSDVEELPDVHTIFEYDLIAGGSKLKYFNSEVCGVCDFNKLSSLVEIGPNAKFGGVLNCYRTNIKRFNNKVGGKCNLVVESLIEIGNTYVNGNLIYLNDNMFKYINKNEHKQIRGLNL